MWASQLKSPGEQDACPWPTQLPTQLRSARGLPPALVADVAPGHALCGTFAATSLPLCHVLGTRLGHRPGGYSLAPLMSHQSDHFGHLCPCSCLSSLPEDRGFISLLTLYPQTCDRFLHMFVEYSRCEQVTQRRPSAQAIQENPSVVKQCY